jgi:hypothetical protein
MSKNNRPRSPAVPTLTLIKNCGNCAAFEPAPKGAKGTGTCHRGRPTPIFLGWGQHPVTHQQIPMVDSWFPPLPDVQWCLDHVPATADGEAMTIVGRHVDEAAATEPADEPVAANEAAATEAEG